MARAINSEVVDRPPSRPTPMGRPVCLSLALGAIALLTAVGLDPSIAHAQAASPDNDPQQQYQRQQDQYDQARVQYEEQSDDYAAKRLGYERERRAYEQEREAYDARYGSGAFVRYYLARPSEYDDRYGPGAYDRDFGHDER